MGSLSVRLLQGRATRAKKRPKNGILDDTGGKKAYGYGKGTKEQLG